MKKPFWIVSLAFIATSAAAQSFEELKKTALQEFNAYKQVVRSEYDDFRQKANIEYVQFMRSAWIEHSSQSAIAVPKRYEPPTPTIKDSNLAPLTLPHPLVVPKVTPIDQQETTPAPVITPVPTPKTESKPVKAPTPSRPKRFFEYYGTPCYISLDNTYRFKLDGVNNNAIADVWSKMSSSKYYDIVDELEQLRAELSLCDWGYVKLVEKATTTLFGKEQQNEACIMQAFFLVQSGYKIRMAYNSNKVMLLLASNNNIYGYSYVKINGIYYYVLDKTSRSKSMRIFDKEFPNERLCTIEKISIPNLKEKLTPLRFLSAKKHAMASVELSVNRNLIDFYNEYPVMEWEKYATTPLNIQTRDKLYKALSKSIESKSKVEAANILIDFVQTAFAYKTDQEQFGVERPLFAEETLFYPYCDCEDRAILYSLLMRDLLGLDVVLLHYPNHVATAVSFDHDIPGHYIDYKNKRYFVCDPTYIGASIGESMPQYVGVLPEVIEIR